MTTERVVGNDARRAQIVVLTTLLVIVSFSCSSGPCPEGFLRDNNGNCVEVPNQGDDDVSDDDQQDDDDQQWDDDQVGDDDQSGEWTCTVWGYVHDADLAPGTAGSGVADVEVCIAGVCDTTDQASVYYNEGIDQGTHTISADPPTVPDGYGFQWVEYSQSLNVSCSASDRYLQHDIPLHKDEG